MTRIIETCISYFAYFARITLAELVENIANKNLKKLNSTEIFNFQSLKSFVSLWKVLKNMFCPETHLKRYFLGNLNFGPIPNKLMTSKVFIYLT